MITLMFRATGTTDQRRGFIAVTLGDLYELAHQVYGTGNRAKQRALAALRRRTARRYERHSPPRQRHSSIEQTVAASNPWNEDQPFDYSGLWLGCRTVQESVNEKVTGNPGVDWFDHALRRYFGPALTDCTDAKKRREHRCLMLGASEGGRVRQLCEAGFIGDVVATDIADKALARAKQSLAGFDNVSFVLADLNTEGFAGSFDYIVAEGVLHHVERPPSPERVAAPAGRARRGRVRGSVPVSASGTADALD
jgi:2-polyprenyl-3-methyl-5-hydroxy-6-metoxy-1,4-benzoquinol methylase